MPLSLCGATTPYIRLWETHAMMMTPLDYWHRGFELWLKTAEMQTEIGVKMLAAMPGWDVALHAARAMQDDRLTLKPAEARPAPKQQAPTAANVAAAPKKAPAGTPAPRKSAAESAGTAATETAAAPSKTAPATKTGTGSGS